MPISSTEDRLQVQQVCRSSRETRPAANLKGRTRLVSEDVVPGALVDAVVDGHDGRHVARVRGPALAPHSRVELLLRGVHPPVAFLALVLRHLVRGCAEWPTLVSGMQERKGIDMASQILCTPKQRGRFSHPAKAAASGRELPQGMLDVWRFVGSAGWPGGSSGVSPSALGTAPTTGHPSDEQENFVQFLRTLDPNRIRRMVYRGPQERDEELDRAAPPPPSGLPSKPMFASPAAITSQTGALLIGFRNQMQIMGNRWLCLRWRRRAQVPLMKSFTGFRALLVRRASCSGEGLLCSPSCLILFAGLLHTCSSQSPMPTSDALANACNYVAIEAGRTIGARI